MSQLRQKITSGTASTWNMTGASAHRSEVFIVHAPYVLDQIDVQMKRTGDVGTVTVSLKSIVDNKPSGADLCYGTKDSGSITEGTAEWYSFIMNTSVPVIKGMYAVVVKMSGAGTLTLSITTTGTTYTDGLAYTSADAGVTWTSTTYDLWLKTYGTNTNAAKLVVVGGRSTVQLCGVFGYAESGKLVWTYDTGAIAYGVKRNPSNGYYYIVGQAADNGDGNGTRNTWVLDSVGNYITGAYIDSSAYNYGIDIDSNYLYIITATKIVRTAHDFTGLTTVVPIGFASEAIRVDTAGNIYFCGGGLGKTLYKYNSSLVFQWQMNSTDSGKSIDFVSNGDVIVGTSDGEVRYYKADGSSPAAGTWAYVMFSTAGVSVAVYNDVIYGIRYNKSSGLEERLVALNTSGVRQWGVTTSAGDLNRGFFNNTGTLYVAGQYQEGFHISKIDAVNQKRLGFAKLLGNATVQGMSGDPTFSQVAELKNDIQLYYKMNDNAANITVLDDSGNERHGVASKNTSAMTTTGKINEALNFVDTTTDEVDIGDLAIFDLTPGKNMTCSFWYNWGGTALQDYSTFISKYAKEGADYKGMFANLRDGSNQVTAGMYFPDSTVKIATIADAALLTGWHLVVLRLDRGGSVWLSVDNWGYSASADMSAVAYFDCSNSQDLSLGRPCGISAIYGPWNGKLDCVAIWDRLISQEEEALIWNGGSGTEDFGLYEIPTIIDQPDSIIANIGDTAIFTISAIGVPDPTFQWYKNDVLMPTETATTLSFVVDADSGGDYTCKVSNVQGTVTSDIATLSIIPLITEQSSDTDIFLNQLLSLVITAVGYPTLTYQWYKNGNLLLGETSSSLTFYVLADSGGIYTCVATNVVGSDESLPIVLEVKSNPYIYNLFNLNLDQGRVN